MAICGGDVVQYNALKLGTVDDYCIKLSNFVDGIALPKEKQMKDMVSAGRRK